MLTTEITPFDALAERGAYVQTFFEGRVAVTHVGDTFAGESGLDWSFRHFTDSHEGSRHPETPIARFLPDIAYELGAGVILAPRPVEFNAKVCEEEDLDESILIGNGRREVILMRGYSADGLKNLRRGRTIGFSTGGCAIIALWNEAGRTLEVSHLGRRSLIDESRWNKSLPPRAHESVIDALIENTNHSRFAVRRMRAVILFPISPGELTYSFSDPQFAEINKARRDFIAQTWGLDYEEEFPLELLIRTQLQRYGVLDSNIETIHPPKGSRNTRGSSPDKRDLTLVTRL